MEIKKIISVLGDDKGRVVSAREISKSGGSAVLIEKSILSNGLYYAEDDDADGYGKVAVNVPNSYEPSDEGKVVSSGALVAQSSDTVTSNGTVDTTLINSLTVNVGGYELLGSGSYTWAGGSATLTIPVSYTGTAKQFGAIAVEPIADTAQSVCFCELTDAQLLPSEFAAPDQQVGYGFAWGYRADNTIVLEAYTGGATGRLSASQISVVRINPTYPWRPNTYNWYIWGVAQ